MITIRLAPSIRTKLFPKLKPQILRHRFLSNSPPATSSVGQIASKLPKRLQPYASRFLNRPVSHLTSFLLLHEITAIGPLGGLFWLFHVTQWTPPGMPREWIDGGVQKFGNYARRPVVPRTCRRADWMMLQVRKKGWESFKGDEGARLLLELATAWALVKALLPLRIGLSLWATPWFARTLVIPIINIFKRIRRPSS